MLSLRFLGLPHLAVYRGSEDPWRVGEVREVTAERGAQLLEHGGFERTDAAPSCAACLAKDEQIARLNEAAKIDKAAAEELRIEGERNVAAELDAVRSERDQGAVEIAQLQSEIVRLNEAAKKHTQKRG